MMHTNILLHSNKGILNNKVPQCIEMVNNEGNADLQFTARSS